MLRNLIVIVGVVALTGCGAVMVYKSEAADTLPGIPFYSKTAQYTHETKLARGEIVVSVSVTEKDADGGIVRAATYPLTGPLVLPVEQAANVESKFTRLLANADGKSFDAVGVLATNTLDSLRMLTGLPRTDEVMSNTIGYTMVVGPERYYINTRQPLIGTATGTYKLSADGTLTESTTTVTDDTVKTILSLFPISAKLSKDWDLSPPKTASSTDAVPSKNLLKIEAKSAARVTLYTLQRTPPVEDKKGPLKVSETEGLNPTVQLISRKVASGGDESSGKDDDKTSYKIQGTFTPPKAADGK
jgi:hypothetical protein